MKTIIAIDPDVDKSGVAYFKGELSVFKTMRFYELIDYIFDLAIVEYDNLTIVVEAGWLNKSNWHLKANCSKLQASEIGKRTGANHQIGKLIVEYCVIHKIDVVEKRPLKKVWKGRDGKISHEEIEQFITDFPNRSNQEIRDAALLGWEFMNRPIKIKV